MRIGSEKDGRKPQTLDDANCADDVDHGPDRGSTKAWFPPPGAEVLFLDFYQL